MSASTTAFRSAAGIAGWTSARRAFSCRTLDEDGLCAAGSAARSAGGHRARGESGLRRPADGHRRRDREWNSRLTASPSSSAATTNRNAAAYAFTDSQLFIVRRQWRRAAARSPPDRTPGRSRASRPTARRCWRCSRHRARTRLQRVAPRGASRGPSTGSAARDRPTASIAR